jgi:hypothetical protein
MFQQLMFDLNENAFMDGGRVGHVAGEHKAGVKHFSFRLLLFSCQHRHVELQS